MFKKESRRNFFFYLYPILFSLVYRYGMVPIVKIVTYLKVTEIHILLGIMMVYLTFFFILFCGYLRKITGTDYFNRWKLDIKSIVLFVVLLLFSLFWLRWFSAMNPAAITKKSGEWSYIYHIIPQQSFYIQSLHTMIMILIQVTETLLYQGIMMETFFKNSKYSLDILVCASLFSMHHLQLPWSLASFIAYFLIGISLPIIYKKTKSIYYPICLHFLINYLNIIIVQLLLQL